MTRCIPSRRRSSKRAPCSVATARQGMILSAVAFLAEKPDPTDDEIVAGMNGNICRCNGYVKITKALRCAAGEMRRQEP